MRDLATAHAGKHFVEVSSEMTLLMGSGHVFDAALPPKPVAIAFASDGDGPTISFDLRCDAESLSEDERIVLVIERAAFERVGGALPDEPAYHLPSTLRAIALAIRDSALSGEMLKVYRIGKSIELLCETIRHLNAGELVPLAGDGVLSLEDARRVVAARRMIDERWHEKLTLEIIARACGLNRAKLTRGFRDMFNCSIAEAIAEQRLNQASRMLLTTSLPISSVGYENGYLNNASFARAFARRFGVSPSHFRHGAVAAGAAL